MMTIGEAMRKAEVCKRVGGTCNEKERWTG